MTAVQTDNLVRKGAGQWQSRLGRDHRRSTWKRSGRRRSRAAPVTPTARVSSSATACGSSTRSTARASRRSSCSPTWLVHARHWKMQIPYLARHFRVLAMDGLGNGRSDRCRDPRRYGAAEFARDGLAVMDATGTERARDREPLARRPVRAGAGAARPRAGRRRRVHRPVLPLHPVALDGACSARCPVLTRAFQICASPSPLVGALEPGHWRDGLPRVRASGSSRGAFPEPHSTQGDRGRDRLGAGDRPRDADRDGGVAKRASRARASLRELARSTTSRRRRSRGCTVSRPWAADVHKRNRGDRRP